MLIVLDNCEHLAAAVAGLAERLLAMCPALSLLATSREPLGVEGNAARRGSLLSLPLSGPGDHPASRAPAAAALAGVDAVRLFDQRARLVQPSFRVSGVKAAAWPQIRRRLDGLPLAIELAAARMRILSAAQLAERLDDIFGVLTGGARSAPPRHQALRATLDWSYDLLTVAERTVFRRLAVFCGGFTLAAAERVAAGGVIPARDILRPAGRGSPTNHCCTSSRETAERATTCWPSSATTRASGWPRRRGEELPRQAHLWYFTALAEEIGPLVERGEEPRGQDGGAQPGGLEEMLDRLDDSRPDIRAALEFARHSGDTEAALRIAGQLGRYAYLRGHYHEVREWMDQAVVAGAGAPAGLRAKALLGSGRLWPCCNATTGQRSGGSRRRCGSTASWPTRRASPARCRCWAVSPASRDGTPRALELHAEEPGHRGSRR